MSKFDYVNNDLELHPSQAKEQKALRQIKDLAHVNGGEKIQAIKLYREFFDAGLKEAEDKVEEIWEKDKKGIDKAKRK